jgi:hypothetical protein
MNEPLARNPLSPDTTPVRIKATIGYRYFIGGQISGVSTIPKNISRN